MMLLENNQQFYLKIDAKIYNLRDYFVSTLSYKIGNYFLEYSCMETIYRKVMYPIVSVVKNKIHIYVDIYPQGNNVYIYCVLQQACFNKTLFSI